MVLFYLIPKFNYYRPKSKRECLKLLNELSDVKILAGGTDLVVDLKIGRYKPRNIIDISALKELKYIKVNESSIKIGSATVLQDILESRIIWDKIPVLAEAINLMASWQIRNVATLGGNLCNASPAADTAPPLYVLNAKLKLESIEGERIINVTDFFLGPRKTALRENELLTEIIIPYPPKDAEMKFLKLGRRSSFSLSVVAVAVLINVKDGVFNDVRIALNSVAPTPVRARKTEKKFIGNQVSFETINKAVKTVVEEISPISDVRASAEYRREMSVVLTRDAILQALKVTGIKLQEVNNFS